MQQPSFDKQTAETEIRKTFPKAEIVKYERCPGALANVVYKVKIKNPKNTLIAKLYVKRHQKDIAKNIKIMDFLRKHNIPTPKTYSNSMLGPYGITIMSCIEGDDLSVIYKKAGRKKREKILKNMMAMLGRIHNSLKPPKFWTHRKHELKDRKEWIDWTNTRIRKYLIFAKKYMKKKHHDYIKLELNKLRSLLKEHPGIRFVPLHWDYRLQNLIGKDRKITAVLDFDNAMKGHNLSDLGQTFYWILADTDEAPDIEMMLEAYQKYYNEIDKQFVFGYFLLHIIAVTRTNWKKKQLRWLMRKHEKILDRCIRGEFRI